MEFITYRHVVNLGDLISVLPGIKHLYEETGKKAIVYQQLNRPGEYYIGAQHPTVNEKGEMVCFSQKMFDMMHPLLLSQEYIEDFRLYTGEKVEYDLDIVRQQIYCGAPHFPLHKWTWMAFPEMNCDLSKDWINANPADCLFMNAIDGKPCWWQAGKGEQHNRIIVNLTDRYRNYNINYFFLKQFENDIVFAGTESEYQKFCEQWNLKVNRLIVNDFFELACAVKGCRFFLGNQSFCWHLSEAMKVPRILELYPYAQNCTNFGANGYEFYHQHQLECFVNKLYNE